MRNYVLLLAILTWLSLGIVSGSSGDRNPSFIECLVFCKSSGCTSAYKQPPTCSDLCTNSFSMNAANDTFNQLRLLLWDCSTDCDYLCMHAVQAALLETYGTAITSAVKYHGKWPFVRAWAIIQEPASVIFSLANLMTHAHGFWTVFSLLWLSRKHSIEKHLTYAGGQAMQLAISSSAACWLVYAGLHMLAWVASAMLHTRDTQLTERLDYCAADVALCWGLLMACTRVALLVLPQTALHPSTHTATKRRTVAVVCCMTLLLSSCLAAQLYYLLFVKFDHEWNVKVGMVAGAAQGLLWVFLCRQENHPGRHWLYCFLLLLCVSALLEVCDFPPTRMYQLEVDAHALWHAATCLITPLLYRFVWHDVRRGLSHVDRLKHE